MKKEPIKILYEDDYIIVIEKAEGVLSVSTSRGRDEITAHSLLNSYVRNTAANRGFRGRRENGNSNRYGNEPRAFIVHRLDRETSGLMVFAKSEEIKRLLQENWEEAVTHRGYVAVVNSSGRIDGAQNVMVEYLIEEDGDGRERLNFQEGRITSWLKENRAMVVYSSARNNGGQLAVTDFKILESNPHSRKTLLQLELHTGRKNQIRVHMQEAGCPIWGDRKYFGANPAHLAENKKAHRLYLHAYALSFIHPVTEKEMVFNTGIPRSFRNL
jgi:23S rRNA pseudouridine1911/1915/1917 synthase